MHSEAVALGTRKGSYVYIYITGAKLLSRRSARRSELYLHKLDREDLTSAKHMQHVHNWFTKPSSRIYVIYHQSLSCRSHPFEGPFHCATLAELKQRVAHGASAAHTWVVAWQLQNN